MRTPVDPAVCTHPPTRLFMGEGRDDRAPGGRVSWLACCDCGSWLGTYLWKPGRGRAFVRWNPPAAEVTA